MRKRCVPTTSSRWLRNVVTVVTKYPVPRAVSFFSLIDSITGLEEITSPIRTGSEELLVGVGCDHAGEASASSRSLEI